MYAVTNPVDERLVQKFSTCTESEIVDAVSAAHQEYLIWSRRDLDMRIAIIKKAAALFAERSDKFVGIMSREMG